MINETESSRLVELAQLSVEIDLQKKIALNQGVAAYDPANKETQLVRADGTVMAVQKNLGVSV